MTMPSPYRGLTCYVCFGKYAGWGVRRDMGIRLILGWMSIAILHIDIEVFIGLAGQALADQSLPLLHSFIPRTDSHV